MEGNNSRRNFMKMGGAIFAAGTAGLAGTARSTMANAAPAIATRTMAALPKARGPRLVVVGGGHLRPDHRKIRQEGISEI